ncbi:unnamed protein product [Brassicogethes aeneus]|uniref:Uncharacterized protein n=1 Tax=Brassicogethes aeneus TaxID=1431903 RepID=A0A9P0FDH6_BRAAE|nr:unnamed protein product [Brassicogethes aeneus]
MVDVDQPTDAELHTKLLKEQMEELKQKEQEAETLQQIEDDQYKKKKSVVEILEWHLQEESRRLARECALYNVREHKQKLKQKTIDVQENLAMENEILLKLENLELDRVIHDAMNRQQIKEGFEKYANLVKMQQNLEKDREKELDFVFDSEAKVIFERQSEVWKSEEKDRQKLLKEVLATIKQQIEDNLEKNRERQKELEREKEEHEKNIQEYNEELEKLSSEKENNPNKQSQRENIKLKELSDELDGIEKEEEWLKKEVSKTQKKHFVEASTMGTHRFY